MEGFSNPKYFDYAASSLPWEESLNAFRNTSRRFYANPSSNHNSGKEAKLELLRLKKEFCDILHFFDGRLLLCASGSEANNTLIEGHLNMFPQGKILMAEDVHESIWYATEKYQNRTKILNIDSSGEIPLDKFNKSLTRDVSMVCISHVCNETGIIHPIKEMSELCYRKQIRILVDGAQSVGHLPLHLDDIPCTYFSFSGHKFGSVRSTGGILIRDDQFVPFIHGGKQEWKLRAGTENIAGLSAMLAALKKSCEIIDEELKRAKLLKKRIIDKLGAVPNLVVNSSENSVPGILSISIPGYTGKEIVSAMALLGFAISTGSACQDSQMDPPRIITAMGRNKNQALGTIRLSMGVGTTAEAVNEFINALLDLIR